MQRPLDIIPELVGANYNITTVPAFEYEGTLYTVRDFVYSHTSLIGMVSAHGADLFVHSISKDAGLHSNVYGSYRREQHYIVRFVLVKPDRAASRFGMHILK